MLYAAQKLQKRYSVQLLGFCREKLAGDAQEIVESCGKPVESADVILLPPLTADGQGQIPAPYGGKSLDPKEVLEKIGKYGVVFGGNDKGICRTLCQEKKIPYIDYINSSAMAQANAVPTVEGALKIALEQTGRTIWDSHILVTGCGRIGTLLADRLRGLGAHVTAAARQEYDRVRMRTMGMETAVIPLDAKILFRYDVIFNTAPAEIFREEHLHELRTDCPLIDLASAPGGADRKTAEKIGCCYVWAPGLPPEEMGCHRKLV